jgi:hypothetical protein
VGEYFQMVAGAVVVRVHVDTGEMIHQYALNAVTAQHSVIGCILVLWHYLHLSCIGSL